MHMEAMRTLGDRHAHGMPILCALLCILCALLCILCALLCILCALPTVCTATLRHTDITPSTWHALPVYHLHVPASISPSAYTSGYLSWHLWMCHMPIDIGFQFVWHTVAINLCLWCVTLERAYLNAWYTTGVTLWHVPVTCACDMRLHISIREGVTY